MTKSHPLILSPVLRGVGNDSPTTLTVHSHRPITAPEQLADRKFGLIPFEIVA